MMLMLFIPGDTQEHRIVALFSFRTPEVHSVFRVAPPIAGDAMAKLTQTHGVIKIVANNRIIML